jgi:glycerol kinase
MARYLLGIDQGTTATKAVLFNERLEVVADATRPLRSTRHPYPGWVEQDPDELVASIVEAVGRILRPDREIVASGLDNQGETIVPWDRESGQALGPAIVWQCKRSQPIVDRLLGTAAGARIVERSRLPLDPYFAATKFRWCLEELPAVRQAAERGTLVLGTSDVWLRSRFGAALATDPSTASRTQLLDLRRGEWDAELLAAFELPVGAMPAIQPSVGDLGYLDHHTWDRPIPLRASLVDQQAALAGHGCFERAQMKATYGTGVFVLSNAGDQLPQVDGLLPTVAWQLGEELTYALDGGVFAAGTMIDWMSDVLGLFAHAAETEDLARSVRDTGGVWVLPALAGLGAPWWRSDATGMLVGLRNSTQRGHIARAALEAIAHRVADIVERAAEAIGEIRALSVDGGLTANSFLLQVQADLLGLPLTIASTSEATARGSAALAALGAGLFRTVAQVGERVSPGRRIEPRQTPEWRDEHRAAWRQFVTRASSFLPPAPSSMKAVL